jgi:hypothetical protein
VGHRNAARETGLPPGNPVMAYFKSGSIGDFLTLDDTVLWGAVEAMTRAEDTAIAELAKRLRDRRLFKTLDLALVGADAGKQAAWAKRIDRQFKEKIARRSVLKDEAAKLSIYTEVGGDEERMHKKLHVLDGERPVEISNQSKLVSALVAPKSFTRYYFSTESDRNAAVGLQKGRA